MKATLILALIATLSMSLPAVQAKKALKPVQETQFDKDLDKAEARDDSQWSKGSVVINASPEVVWHAVHEERNSDPDLAYSKILEQKGNESRLEQKFTFIPVFGSAVCEMRQVETPLERIDYKMIRSDRFKQMEGSWVFTPLEGGKQTKLELSTILDMGLPVPRGMVSNIATKKIKTRLSHVKEMAEKGILKTAQVKKTAR